VIVCSIDLMGGKAVQLQQGERLVLEREDVVALAERFSRCGEIAVIDLDAARGRGENIVLIEELCRRFPCRVGGGIRDAERAKAYLRAGAQKVILGTAAVPEILNALPRERMLVALDTRAGRVATHGWQALTDETPLDRAFRLAPYCGGFLLTNIEREGLLGGVDFELANALHNAVDSPITIAGGVRSIAEISELDRRGIDAQVGMALYTGRIDPVEAVIATLDFEKGGGLIPTIVCAVDGGRPRMLAYSSPQSMRAALHEGIGAYRSRSRGQLWRKGESSSNTQQLVRISVDCDRDAVIFYVRQNGPTCHRGKERCFPQTDWSWQDLTDRIALRAKSGESDSYTQRLLASDKLLAAKLREEADETARATTREDVAWECADLLYFLSVKMAKANVSIADVMAQLASRAVG
jgi:phosphoribosyl-ATP pyrophosphohydrolase/phosphoribosyl-AMP cyclohydrolase